MLTDMFPEEDLRTASTIFNALGSIVRLRILKMLIETKKPLHIKAVARNLDMDYAAVYRHVHVLRTARLLEVYEVGRSRVLAPRKPDLIGELIQRTREVGG
jgi:DNA-binding transcriptional ArsR family regulator